MAAGRKAGVCDRDGVELVLRADDRPETAARRPQEYEAKTAPLERHHLERGALAEVNGAGTPEEIRAAPRRLPGSAG